MKMLAQLIVLSLFLWKCFASFDDIIVHKKEVNNTVYEYIVGKVLISLADGLNNNRIAETLTDDMNRKYGNGWQVITAFKADLSALNINHETNSLVYFSFEDYHFYVFKQTNNSNCRNDSFNVAVIHLNLHIICYI